MNGDAIIDNIRTVQRPEDDTLYCNAEYKLRVVDTLFDGSSSPMVRADNVQVSGLEIVTLDGVPKPIVCERGEVFPITEDFK